MANALIGLGDIKYMQAQRVSPGMITVDGVVLTVGEQGRGSGRIVTLEMRSTTYAQKPSDLVGILGSVAPSVLQGIMIAIKQDAAANSPVRE